MRAERIPIKGLFDRPDPDRIAEIVHRIEEGAVFVYPTETIYGIGGRADSPVVAERICNAKLRPAENPMILVAANQSAFAPRGLLWPPQARLLAGRFWPGLLTLVLPDARGQTCAVRVSPHPFVRALGQYCSFPLYSTSANLSGATYVNDPDAIYEQFADSVDFMVDAGVLPSSLPSTVVQIMSDGSVSVLREGAISAEHIFECLHNGSAAE